MDRAPMNYWLDTMSACKRYCHPTPLNIITPFMAFFTLGTSCLGVVEVVPCKLFCWL